MSVLRGDPSPNGRHPPSSWTSLRVERPSTGCCRVTFDHPPSNTVTASMIAELAELAVLIEADPDLNVVVFDSADPRVYLAGPAGWPAWLAVLARIARAPAVSIASVRGRADGAGREFVHACDLRFTAHETAAVEDVAARLAGADREVLRRVKACARRAAWRRDFFADS
ncbi:enoyl-CoA hydratase-related protein [Jiangella ureilytica]|uniref:enoyl-CoA hydratase-related protein n=1 Tax=Jiangella ureilytica TaxID=2530374 RepID=UPI0013A5BFC4|nr:enoyl-CoA hydratase-related protein [Jiangella ureilytica]